MTIVNSNKFNPILDHSNKNYQLAESNAKPVARGSALFTLKNIENILKNKFSFTSNEQFPEMHTNKISEILADRARQIKDGYDVAFEKQSSISKSWNDLVKKIYSLFNQIFAYFDKTYRLKTEQEKIAETFAQINLLLEPPKALGRPLNEDIYNSLFSFFTFPTLKISGQINRHAHALTANAVLLYAREYGFVGENPRNAQQFISSIIKESIGFFINLSLTAKNEGIDNFASTYREPSKASVNGGLGYLLEFKGLTKLDMLQICSYKHTLLWKSQDRKNFLTFLLHFNKPCDVSPISPDDMKKYGSIALRNAIHYKEHKFLELFLQYGLEPTSEHLKMSFTSSLEVVTILLNHQAQKKQDEKYCLMGIDALGYVLNPNEQEILKLFLVRSMPLKLVYNICQKWCIFQNNSWVLEYICKHGVGNSKDPDYLSKILIVTFKAIALIPRFKNSYMLKNNVKESFSSLLTLGTSIEKALKIATICGCEQMITLIIEMSASAKNLLSKDSLNQALIIATGYKREIHKSPIYCKNIEVVKTLLDNGASGTVKLLIGDVEISALEAAQNNGFDDIVNLIKNHKTL